VSDAVITIEGIVVRQGAIEALHGVDLTVQAGSIVSLLGANGAGKTTLLNTVSGFLRPVAGRIAFQGRSILGLAPASIARAGLLHVPEGRQILGALTVRENLELGALASRGRKPANAYGIDDVFKLFPILSRRQEQAGGSLSGGEQQMLAIGRALMGCPDVLLLDEPSLGLAPKIVDQVFSALVELNGRGLSILMVEQNARRALEISQRAYIIRSGMVVGRDQAGPCSKMHRSPPTTWVSAHE
jgi:branched-chain amino acid transport system ATP-binding protein